MTVSQKQNQKLPSRHAKNIAPTAAKRMTPGHSRLPVRATAQRHLESPPAVVIPSIELMLVPDRMSESFDGTDLILRAVESLRALHEAGQAGSEAALCVLDTGNALVADWVQNRIYHVELEFHRTPEVVPNVEMASSLIGTTWVEVRVTPWARAANLRDAELAAALKAAQQFVVRLGLRVQDATVGGREVGTNS
jgi:hypothetical protein